jgi:hypothetical protein
MRMSAYVVENKTINTIVTWLADELRRNPFLREKAHTFKVDVESVGWKEQLAKAMFALNVSAVNQRYHEQHTPNGFLYQPVFYGSRIAAFKSLRCWKYQCTEGNIPETNLYQYFEELEKQIAINIVIELPQYEEAQWG